MEKIPATPATREQFDGEADFRARERNKYRSVWQKMFGRDKSDSMDMIMEEAIAMNAAIDKELKNGRVQDMDEALDVVDQMSQFQLKGTERVKVEEYARTKTLQIGEAIESNEFYKASSILYREQHKKGVDKETAQVMSEQTTAFVKQHVGSLAEAKDGKNLVNAISAFDSRLDKSDISPEAAKSPEILKAVSDDLISYFRTFAVSEPKVFVKEVERFTKFGLAEREKIVQTPEIKEFTRKEAISYFQTFATTDPKAYQRIRDSFVALGVGTVEEYNQLAEIQKVAREEVASYQRTFGATQPEVVRRVRNSFVQLGINLVGEVR